MFFFFLAQVLCLEAAPVLLGDAVSEMLGFLWSPAVIPGCERALPPPPSSSTSSLNSSTPASATHAHTTSDPGIGMNACTADRFALRATAERWRRDALLPLALGADSDGDGEGGEGGRAIWGEEVSFCLHCVVNSFFFFG